jgi:signal transduction histidine kinase
MQNTYLKRSRRIPLQLVLIVPFVVQIVAAVGLVGYLSFQNGQKAVNDLAEQLTDKASDLVDQHLDDYLSQPHKLNQINADAVKLELLDLRDRKKAGQYFWKQMQVYNFSYISGTNTDGTRAGAARYDGKTVTIDDSLSKTFDTSATDGEGNRTQLLKTKQPYDCLNEGWYINTVKAGKAIWSQISVWDNPGNPYIAASANRPIYDAENQLIGVLGVDIHLLKLSDFLRKLKASPSGHVFIIERDGMLIANSSKQQPYALVNGKVQRLKAIESPDLLVRGISQQIHKKLGFQQITQHQDLQLDFQGERQYVHIEPWQDKYGLDWLVVVVLPERDFMQQINANTRTNILLCLAALGIAIALGIYTSRWIAQPILNLNRASMAIADGNLEQNLEEAGIRELSGLSESFNRMAKQLQAAFTQLEDRVAERTQELSVRNNQLQSTLEQLHRTQSQMIQNEKMSALGQMVAGVAHEINNPVNFIHGNLSHVDGYTQDLLKLLQIYQENYPNPHPAVQEYLDDIELEFVTEDLVKILQSMEVGTHRIRQIVLSLRNFSRLAEAEFKEVDIHEGIDSTIVILNHRLKAKSERPEIKIIREYGKIPLVECYAGQLNQVFMNLLTNAIDALEESNQGRSFDNITSNPNTIWIHTIIVDEHRVQICIADNGCGIPENIQTKLFDPFFTTKPVGKGTGMGLSISYQIITEKHQGRIWCDSTLGQGTKFMIEIPLHPCNP